MRDLLRMRLCLTLIVAVALLPACVVYDGDADVIIAWDFDGQGCGPASVSEVFVTLEGLSSGELHIGEGVPCEQGAFVFLDLPPQDYFVLIEAEEQPGVVTWAFEGRIGDVHPGENEFLLSLFPVLP